MEEENKIMTDEKDEEKSETNTIITTTNISKMYNDDEEQKEAVVERTLYGLLDEFVRAVLRCLGLNTQEDQPSQGGGDHIDVVVDDPTATSDPHTDFPIVKTMEITGMLRRKPPTPPLAKGIPPQHH